MSFGSAADNGAISSSVRRSPGPCQSAMAFEAPSNGGKDSGKDGPHHRVQDPGDASEPPWLMSWQCLREVLGVPVGTSRFELREKHVWSHHSHWEAIVEHEGEQIGTVLQNTSAVNSKSLGAKTSRPTSRLNGS